MRRFGRIVVFAAVILISMPPPRRAAAEGTTTHKASVSAAAPMQDPADLLVSACNSAGLSLSSPVLPAMITKVTPGSPAYNADLVERDRVVSGQLGNNVLSLVIERNGHVYATQINCSASSNTAASESAAGSKSGAKSQTPPSKTKQPPGSDVKASMPPAADAMPASTAQPTPDSGQADSASKKPPAPDGASSSVSSTNSKNKSPTSANNEPDYAVKIDLGVGTSNEGAHDWHTVFENECRDLDKKNAWSEWTESVQQRLSKWASITRPVLCDLRLRVSTNGHIDEVVVIQEKAKEKGIVHYLTGEAIPENLKRFVHSMEGADLPPFPEGSAITAAYIGVSVAPKKGEKKH